MATRAEAAQRLAKLKTRLAEKYESLASQTPSEPRRARLARKAQRYRRQAAELAR